MKNIAMRSFATLFFALSFLSFVHAAEIPLYPTGPSADSSFVRFINGTDRSVELTAAGSQAKIELDGKEPATSFYPVAAKADIKGRFASAGATADVSVQLKPGEFVSVIALNDGAMLKQVVVGEEPDDFNALKVSLSFVNVSAGCAKADLQVAGRSILLFENVVPEHLLRRSINPVRISVQLLCAGQPAGLPLNLGELTAGERYSVFAVPSANSSRIFLTSDSVSR